MTPEEQYEIIRAKRHDYYVKNKDRIKKYHQRWRKNNPEKMKKYNYYERKRKGYVIYNETEEKFFEYLIDIRKFLNISYVQVKMLIEADYEINGWKGEEIL